MVLVPYYTADLHVRSEDANKILHLKLAEVSFSPFSFLEEGNVSMGIHIGDYP